MDQTIPLPLACPDCAARMPETAVFCPGCGRSMQPVTRARGKVGALPENVAGALAYFTVIPAVVFLLLEPYKRNSFVRFHSIQCVLFWIAAFVVGLLLFIVPAVAPLLISLISVVALMATGVLWAVMVVKAFQGEMFKLPVLGDFAEMQSGSL
jgi:uncharacterized membrane protein